MKRLLLTIAFVAGSSAHAHAHDASHSLDSFGGVEGSLVWSNECDWMNPKPAYCFPLQSSEVSQIVSPVPANFTSTVLPTIGWGQSEMIAGSSQDCPTVSTPSEWVASDDYTEVDSHVCTYGADTALTDTSPVYDQEVVRWIVSQQPLVQTRMPSGRLSWDFSARH